MIELQAPAPDRQLSLEAVRRALATLDVGATLSVAPDPTDWGGIDSAESSGTALRVRLLTAVPAARAAERAATLPTPDVVIVDGLDCIPGGPLGADVDGARLVLVPGEGQRRALEGRVRGSVRALGLPRLDPLFEDGELARARAHEALGVPEGARLILLAPGDLTSDGDLPVGREGDLPVGPVGTVIAVWPGDSRPGALPELRRLALRRPGWVWLEGIEPTLLLAAADVMVGGRGGPLSEAALLGRPVVAIGTESLGDALERALAGRFDELEVDGLLEERGSSAFAVAKAIAELLAEGERPIARRAERAEPVPANTPQATPTRSLDSIRARAAFGDTDGAAAELSERLASDPDVEAGLLLAALQRERGECEAAGATLARVEAWAGTALAKVHCERGRLAVACGDLDGAREAFQAARRGDPGLAAADVGLGSLALQGGAAAEALGYFERALAAEDSPRAHSGRGLALVSLGRPKDALAPLEAALDREPDCLAALYGLVQVAFQSGELERAAERAERFVELHPGNLDIAFTLAGLRCELGNASGALELCDRIALFAPDYEGLEELRAKLG